MIFVAMATMMLTSCVQEEGLVNESLSSSPKEITFQTVVAKQSSRALINTSEYGQDAPSFGAWARYNPADDNLNVGYQNYITNAEVVYFPATSTSVAYWGLNDSKPWPDRGSLTFFAYSPFEFQEDTYQAANYTNNDKYLVDPSNVQAHSPQVGNHGIVFPNYDVDAHQQTDLMVADVVKGLKANITANTTNNNDPTLNNPTGYTGVPTKFRHKLAKIDEFIVKTSDDYDGSYSGNDDEAVVGEMRFFIQKIELLSLKTKASYYGETYKKDGTLVPDRWVDPTVQQVSKTYVWFDADKAHGEANSEQQDKWFDSYTVTVNGVEEIHYAVPFGHSETKTLNIKSMTSEQEYDRNPTIENQYLLVIPQTFNNNQAIRVTYYIRTYKDTQTDEGTDGLSGGTWEQGTVKTVTRPLSEIHGADAKWPMNAKISYTLLFSTEEIRWAPYVGEWTTFGNNIVDF